MTLAPTRHEITKYPNRRFYDVTRSRHVTLSDLHDLVAGGAEIVVTDKSTGRDITNIVLTQIILEHDPPKMELFPSSLLHQAIQMNENVVRRFIDQYFAQAMSAFAQSRRQFESFLGQSGFNPMSPTAPMEWLRMFMPGMPPSRRAGPADEESQPSGAAGVHEESAGEGATPPLNDVAGRDDDLAALRRQVAAMSEQLSKLQPETTKRRPKQKTKAKKKSGRTRKARRG